MLRGAFGETHYMVHFQEPGVADAGLARDVRRVFTQLSRRGVPPEEAVARLAVWGRMPTMVEMVESSDSLGEPLLGEDDLAVYVDAFTRTGFTGGLNWYRNLDRNWETTPELAGARITVPSLMVVAEWDAALPPALAEPMRGLVDDLELVTIPRCGHWTPQERPDELNRILVGLAAAAVRHGRLTARGKPRTGRAGAGTPARAVQAGYCSVMLPMPMLSAFTPVAEPHSVPMAPMSWVVTTVATEVAPLLPPVNEPATDRAAPGGLPSWNCPYGPGPRR